MSKQAKPCFSTLYVVNTNNNITFKKYFQCNNTLTTITREEYLQEIYDGSELGVLGWAVDRTILAGIEAKAFLAELF
jgi:hypothetical protein